MGESLADRLGNVLHISYTENERKRDDYYELYEYLKSEEKTLRNHIEDAESAKRFYEKKNKGLPHDKIPAREFEEKRLQKDDILSELMTHFDHSLDDVISAKKTAYDKYLEYKAKAEAEERAAEAERTAAAKKK